MDREWRRQREREKALFSYACSVCGRFKPLQFSFVLSGREGYVLHVLDRDECLAYCAECRNAVHVGGLIFALRVAVLPERLRREAVWAETKERWRRTGFSP